MGTRKVGAFCGVRDDQSGTPAEGANASTAAVSMALKSGGTAQILLFNGTGTSPNDVKAFETILKDQHVNYLKVNSSQLNAMSESEMRGYGLLIVPGGNFIDIGNGLTQGYPGRNVAAANLSESALV
jgi:hypothetical protein